MIARGFSPSVRLFEAAACGTAIISDRWRGFGDLLPESEAAIVADGSEDVVRALEEVTEAQRESMAKTARRIVLTHHTGEARARELCRIVRAQGAHRQTRLRSA